MSSSVSYDQVATDDEVRPDDQDEKKEAKELQILSEDLRRLDKQSEDHSNVMSTYSKNRFIFLMQSFILGMSYSIVWPTVWTYANQFNLPQNYTKLLYGLMYICYPVASMLSANITEYLPLSTKSSILLLNMLEIIGNVVYTLDYQPAIPCFGRFIAGLGDAFYVVLMKEMKTKYGNPVNEKITVECLGSFIIGVVLAPGINILTTLFHFKIGSWSLTSNNFPGLTMAVIFIIAQFITLIFLSDKPTTSNTSSKEIEEEEAQAFDLSDYASIFIATFCFLYTYIVASLELMIPIILYELFHSKVVGVMLIYAVIGTLYGLILMVTMTVSFSSPMIAYFSITVILQVVGLFSLIYLSALIDGTLAVSVVCIGFMIVSLASMWSNDDVLFISLVQTLVPSKKRENTHSVRRMLSKLAFCIAGFTVPFTYWSAFFIVAPVLIFLVCAHILFFAILRFSYCNQYRSK